MGEMVAFEVAPGALDVVKLGSVFRQPFMVTHGRAARALAVARLVWIGPLSRISSTGLPG